MGDNFRLEKEISQISAGQQGNITRAQLLKLGFDDPQIHRWIKLGRLYRVYPGVYSVGRPPTTPLEKAAAAVLACGPHAALSHSSAMTLWGFWKRWDQPFEVSLTAGDRRPKAIRVHRPAGLRRCDVTTQLGIRVTTPARTLLDCAPRISAEKSLTRVVNDARRSNYLGLPDLADVIARFPFHPGAHRLAQFVDTKSGPTRSGFEDDFPTFCRRHGLPEPTMSVIVCGYEVDALFPRERLIVELDGWDYHSDRDAFESDRDRDADTLAAGFATVRITRERLKGAPVREAARLRAILAARRAAADAA